MLTDAQMDAALEIFQRRMQSVTDFYYQRMGEHIRDIGQLVPSDVHRLQQLRRMNRNLRDVKKRLARAAGMNLRDLEAVLQEAAKADSRVMQKILGVSDARVALRNNVPLQRALRAQYAETAGKLSNLSNSTIVQDAYRKAVDSAVTAVQSGAEDYESAIRRTLRQAGEMGLRVRESGTGAVEYASGHTRRVDTAVRMNVLDAMRRTNQRVMAEVGEQFGANGVEIDAHMLCAEDHLPYQGGQYSNEEFQQIQDGLQRPFGEWNCRHTWAPIIMGVSPPRYTPEDLETFERYSTEPVTIDGKTHTRYEWSQVMRRMETAIREKKDTATLAAAAGDDVLRRQCQGSINAMMREYERLSDRTGLGPDFRRTYVAGFRDAKGTEVLTSNMNDGTVSQSPVFSVSSVSDKRYDPEEYRSALQARFDRGDDLAKALYNRFVPEGGAVSDGGFTGVSEYRSDTKDIRMSFVNDAWNVAGVGTTWFHEHGHYIDAALGNPSHRDSFIRSIIRDCRAYESKIQKEHRLDSIEETRFQVSANMILQGVNTFGVQDIFGGSIGEPYPGAIAKHEKIDYWDKCGREGLGRETFAHMFEACFDDDKASAMKYYLPTAWKEFRSILKEMAE